ncbi:hypothetical protein [Nocardia jiangxiensis]|uniref:Uncharacterized protein n=1 Tax=Nocardia jiangxiensis TaxID=282685 RepID=A0ABW6RV26_9NOCA|nr:hypothetical protein [Nocardia jiangxiensis]
MTAAIRHAPNATIAWTSEPDQDGRRLHPAIGDGLWQFPDRRARRDDHAADTRRDHCPLGSAHARQG